MFIRTVAWVAVPLALLTGCASTMTQDDLESRTAQAVGRSVGQFTITERSEETGGRVNFTVNVKGGGSYRCYVYGATAFQKAMSFGQTPHSDPVCNAMAGGQARSSKTPSTTEERSRNSSPECNALLKAAGRC